MKPDRKFYLTYSFRFVPEIAWIANKILSTFKQETKPIKGLRAQQITDESNDYAIIARTNAFVFDEAARLCDSKKITFLGD